MAWDISKNGTPAPTSMLMGCKSFFFELPHGTSCTPSTRTSKYKNLEGFYAPNDPCWGHPLVWVCEVELWAIIWPGFYSSIPWYIKFGAFFHPKKSIISLICTIRTKIRWYRWRIGSHVFLLKHSVRWCSCTTLEKSEDVFRSSN